MSRFTALFPQKIKTFFKKFKKFNALNNIDKRLLEYLNYPNGFFIECGANDGVNQSNTWYFEKNLNWKGILIEPLENGCSFALIYVTFPTAQQSCTSLPAKKFKLSSNRYY